MYNSGKPWGKYGAVYYQQHIINWREVLVWIHKHRIDVDRRRLYLAQQNSLYNQLKWVKWNSYGVDKGNLTYWIYGFETDNGVVCRHRFQVQLEVIF
jgi:hypothetical protein